MTKFLLLLSFVIGSHAGYSQMYKYDTYANPKDKSKDNLFGYCMAGSASSERLAVGCPNDKKSGMRSGAVYIYNAKVFKQICKIKSPIVKSNQAFGKSLDLDNKHLIIGAPCWQNKTNDAGSAYVFYQNRGGIDNWGSVAELKPSKSESLDGFGSKVKIDKHLAFVSAPKLNGEGAVFIFARNKNGKDSWGQIAMLKAPIKSNSFGASIDFDGTFLAVGAPGENEGAGAIYLFSKNKKSKQWNLVNHINSNKQQRLGETLALYKGRLASKINKGISGGVRVFHINTKGKLLKTHDLFPKRSNKTHDFGKALSFYGDYLLVGSPAYLNRGLLSLYHYSENESWEYCFDDNHQFHVPPTGSKYGFAVCFYNHEILFGTETKGMYGGKLVKSKVFKIAENSGVLAKVDTDVVKIGGTIKINTTPKKLVNKYEPLTRILQLKKNIDLGLLHGGSKLDFPLELVNEGNAPILISNIYHSKNIRIKQKQIKIEPYDSYTLNYSLNVSFKDETRAYIEIVSNKTKGNNRVNISCKRKDDPIYLVDCTENIEGGLVVLGTPKEINLSITNKGNSMVYIEKIDCCEHILFDISGDGIAPNETKLIPFKFVAHRTGLDETGMSIYFKDCNIIKDVHVSTEVIANVNETMAQSRGLILSPTMNDKRLLVNMNAAKGQDVKINIYKGITDIVKQVELKNDGTQYYFISTHDLPRGAYMIKGFVDGQTFPLGQGMLQIH